MSLSQTHLTKTPQPDEALGEHTLVDDRGTTHTYQLADRQVTLTYQDGGQQRTLACRQITRKSANGHQTQILTSRTDLDPAVIAHAMFTPLGGEENFFRCQRMRFDLDGLDAYATVCDDPDRMVPNPAKKRLPPAGQSPGRGDRAGAGLPRPAHPKRRGRSRA